MNIINPLQKQKNIGNVADVVQLIPPWKFSLTPNLENGSVTLLPGMKIKKYFLTQILINVFFLQLFYQKNVE